MGRKIRSKIILSVCSILFAFIVAEVTVRCLGYYDADGNFFFLSRKLKPYHLPVASVRGMIERLSSSGRPGIYDPDLGWSSKPYGESKDGLYHFNSDGMRTISCDFPVFKTHPADVLRIALFGDSFTNGADVSFTDTWGACLENDLKQAGLHAEVLNFGVGGYGMDQAFLLWKKSGYQFSPDVVIFGFQPENVKRNLNLIRALYSVKTDIPFSKPRYILEGEVLKLINAPTLRPDALISTMEHMDSWDLVKYEHWYDPENYRHHLWLNSKLIAFILDYFDRSQAPAGYKESEYDFYSPDDEPARLALKIIRTFKNDVESKGAEFYAVYLPSSLDLKILSFDERLPYARLLEKIEAFVPVIHPEKEMLAETAHSIFDPVHYSPTGNRIVARAIANFILQQQDILRESQ